MGHPNHFTINTALPPVLCNTTIKYKVNLKYICQENQGKDTHRETVILATLYQ